MSRVPKVVILRVCVGPACTAVIFLILHLLLAFSKQSLVNAESSPTCEPPFARVTALRVPQGWEVNKVQ